MKQQTAVEWLYNHLFPKQLDGFSDEEWGKIDKAFEQAKQMEKEQIIDSHLRGLIYDLKMDAYDQAKQFYDETYGGQGSPDTSPNTQNK